MSNTQTQALQAAQIVLSTGAVYTRTDGDPFFFSSGWASPVFIDIKRLISYPAARNSLLELALNKIDEQFGKDAFDQIAGCELAGIPFASMIADRHKLPLVVVKKQSRGFGRLSQFEGTFEPRARTLLVDDLTTDGRTKITFSQALETAEASVVGIFVLLDYNIFPAPAGITSLMTLADIIAAAGQSNTLDPKALQTVQAFQADAPSWSKRHGGI